MAASASWHPARLLGAPHRLLFAVGALAWAGIALWWAAVSVLTAIGHAPPWAVAPAGAHALVLALGFMPAFIAGFLFTAGPKWLALPPVAVRPLRGPAALWLAGWALALPGLHLDARCAAAGTTLAAVGWTGLCVQQQRLLRASRVPAPDRLHARAIGWALWWIAVALAAAALALATGPDPQALRAAARLGLWGVASVFLTAAHRLTPFFHPAWLHRLPGGLLGPLQAGLALRAAADMAALGLGPAWPAAAHLGAAAGQAVLAAATLATAFDPALRAARRTAFVRMLHVAVVWLAASCALQALTHGTAAHGQPGGWGDIALAALHAATLGFMLTTLLAMASRVTATQQGRAVAVDRPLRWLFRLLQATALARLAASLWPGAPAWLLPGAALSLALIAVAWMVHPGRLLAAAPRTPGSLNRFKEKDPLHP